MIRSVLGGERGPARDIVLANAAAGLWVSGKTHSLMDGVAIAAKAIDSGAALKLLKDLAEMSSG